MADLRLNDWTDTDQHYDVVFLPGIRRSYTPGLRESEKHQLRMQLPP